ncbi:MAG: murein L,D-transpeptidase [Flavobacteriaceae bacterium]
MKLTTATPALAATFAFAATLMQPYPASAQTIIERVGPDGYVRRYVVPQPTMDPSRQVPPQRYYPPDRGYYAPREYYRPNPYEGYPRYRRDGREWNGGQDAYQQPAPQIQQIAGPEYHAYKPDPVVKTAVRDLLPSQEDGPSNVDQSTEDAGAAARPEGVRLDRALVAPDASVGMEKAIAEALKAHYAAKPYALWVDEDGPNAAARAALEIMREAGGQGLEVNQYEVRLPPATRDADTASRQAELMIFEVTMSARVLRYAMDMKDGAIHPNRISGYHDLPAPTLPAKDAIAAVAASGDPAGWLKQLEPQQAQYRALKKELAALKDMHEEPIVIAEGTLIRPGGMDLELPQIVRALEKKADAELLDRHRDTLDAYDGGLEYGPGLVDLVKDFQKAHGLKVDGVLGQNTIGRLTGDTVEARTEKVRLAMERMRWLPETFGARHVIINQPAYVAMYREGERTVLETRAIVGSKSNQTYFFTDEIETVVYNPYWGVPQSIIVNEMLPKLYRDPSYLDRNGYEVSDSSGRRISSSQIDWRQYNGKVPFDVRQKPGPGNALGGIKILFPNAHAIYMHDTPERQLFSRDMRALSHGCVRLQEPQRMAALLLGQSEEHVRSNIADGSEHEEALKEKVPVYVAYFTAWPDDSGTVHYYADMYDRDEHLAEAVAKTGMTRLAGEMLPAVAEGD